MVSVIWMSALLILSQPTAFKLAALAFFSCIIALVFHHYKQHNRARFIWLSGVMISIWLGDFIAGPYSRANEMLIVTIVVPILLFSWQHERRYILFFAITSFLLWLSTLISNHQLFPILEIPPEISQNYLSWISDFTVIITIAMVMYFYVRDSSNSEAKLSNALKKANAANKTKSQFLANMSHEIRTPMNAIIGMTNLALKTGLTNKQADYIRKANLSAENLLGIINDILDYSKIEAGKLELEKTEFKLSTVFNHMQNMIKFKAEEVGVQYSVNIDNNVPKNLLGDPLRIGQVLINLTNNAVKFSHAGDTVSVNVTLKESVNDSVIVLFSVSDTGIGMTKDQQKKLFQSFTQVDVSTTREYGGTGLGLAISKQIIELMDGKIWFESQKDIGSTFYFTVKLEKLADDHIYQSDDELVENQLENAIEQLRGCKVMLVEDNELNQELTQELLNEVGIAVEISSNGKEALELLKVQEFDGVLMDCQMPVMDGYEATRQIRSQEKFKNLPVIAMTANAMKSDIEKVLAVGMNDHIAKPVHPDLMFITMAKWIKKPQIAKEHTELKIENNETKESMNSLFELPGIDVEAGLDYAMGKESLYRKMLTKFPENQKDFEKNFKTYLENQDFELAANAAHKLKGLAATLGMKELHQATMSLENACHENNDDIEQSFSSVLDQLGIVLNSLKELN